MPDTARTPDEIWSGDLFKRRDEAQQLIAYIESVVGRPILREDKKAYTIAVDARYGEGKSFFLRRLAETLSINHPVAFVDAWADDLADEPLTALAATLKSALQPFIGEPAIRDGLHTFMQKTGKVAKIVSLGLVRRGLGLLVTGAAVDAAGEVLSHVGNEVRHAIDESLTDVGQDTAEELSRAVGKATSHSLMEKRVAAFEEGQTAIQEMKGSLAAIVASLSEGTHQPPIVIVIDELDRCRPTYAVKLLEEIKHLFDVPGLVFIFAMHGDQLGHSVSGAYGAGFDGRDYLRRFIDRQYCLAEPNLRPLLIKLCGRSNLPENRLRHPPIQTKDGVRKQVNLAELLAIYMSSYGLKARDAFQLIDILQTSFALSEGQNLYAAYLLPLIIARIQGLPSGTLPKLVASPKWKFAIAKDHLHREVDEISFEQAASSFQDAALFSDAQILEGSNSGKMTLGVQAVRETRDWNSDVQSLAAVENYPSLMATVSRFSNPAIAAS